MPQGPRKDDMNSAAKIAAGAGIAALAAAAAGAIYFYGTDAGKKKRKHITSLMLRMKADVLDKMGTMKDWSEEGYHSLIDSVASKYSKMKNVDSAQVAELVADMRKHWKAIKGTVEGKPKKKRKTAAKPKKTNTSE